ncbi:thioredoxin family protein [Gelatiniphilus marinus]|uniref:Thioredoxin family protein n=1 Tax=Gelatiniphilus marinus TaxID=1759464 RepID=A0ABW5JSX3_9FLAO
MILFVRHHKYLTPIVILIIALFSCKSSKSHHSATENKYNYKKEKGVLIGKIPLSEIQDNDIDFKWFSKNYKKYVVKQEIILNVKEELNNINIDVYLGTWCDDTKRMLPKFIKILDFLNYDTNKINFIALNRQKKGIKQINKKLNITNVPTIIFYKNNKEINRIVENHVISLESDIKNILSLNNYAHSLSE